MLLAIERPHVPLDHNFSQGAGKLTTLLILKFKIPTGLYSAVVE